MSRTGGITLEKLLLEALVPEEEKPYMVPDNWVWLKLKYISKNSRRNIEPSKYSNEIFELYSVPSFPDGNPELVHGEKIGSNKQIVFENDVLICKINPRINRVWIVGEKNEYRQIASTEWIAINNSEGVYPRFLMHFFRSPYFRNLLTSNVSGVGGSLTRARPKDVQGYPVALPPLNEQKRIADKVDQLLNKINQAKQLIDEAKETFELRQAAILDKAYRGELTVRWRKKNEITESADKLIEAINFNIKKDIKNPKNIDSTKATTTSKIKIPSGWIWVAIEDVFHIRGGGTPNKSIPQYWEGEIPWVSPKDMKTLFIEKTQDTVSLEGINNSSANIVKKDSVVLVVRSGILQRILPVALLMQDSSVNQDMKVFDSGIKEVNEYFMWYIHGHQQQLLNRYSKSGTTVNSIEFDKFKKHLFPLPPMSEIKQILNLINSLTSKENIVHKVVSNTKELDILKQSILSNAFKGKLGTNDPSEDSCLDLLKENVN